MKRFDKEVPKHRDGKVCGAYAIHHEGSGKSYVGSAANIYNRVSEHRSALNNGRHKNAELQAAFNNDPKIVISCHPTETVEEARKIEQVTLNEHRSSGELFNVAIDADAPRRGIPQTAEHTEKIRNALVGQTRTEEQRRRIGENHPSSKAVSIQGVQYPGIKAAARAMGVNAETVRKRLGDTSGKYEDWKVIDSK